MTIVSQPSSLELSGNLPKFVIASAESFTFVLKKANDVIFERIYDPGTSGQVEIDIRHIVEANLSFLLQDSSNPYEQPNIAATFTAEIGANIVTFRVIRAGVENFSDTATNFLTANWLTWQPQIKKVTYYSPEFLTYYSVVPGIVKCKAYYSDGTTGTITLLSVLSGIAYTIPLQYALINSLLVKKLPGYYDVWVENQTGDRLTYIQRFTSSNKLSEDEQWILFENSLGGCDTARCYGQIDFTADHTHNIAEVDETAQEYRVDTIRQYQKNTGHLDDYERRWMLDFFPSKRKYLYVDSTIRQIVVTKSEVNNSSKELPSNYNFTYKFASARPFLNLTRSDTLPVEIALEAPGVESFILPPRLAELPRTSLTGGALIPFQSPYSETWGVMTLESLIAYLNSDGSFPQGIIDSLYSLATDGFLSKINPDTASKLIKFLEGIETGLFVSGTSGSKISADGDSEFKTILLREISRFLKGFSIGDFIPGESGGAMRMIEGNSVTEIDILKVRKRAEFRELVIERLSHIGGETIQSPASMICSKVESFETFYRCYFDKGDNGEAVNTFEALDQARCQVFTGADIKYYWRLVVAVGLDYIDLSISDCDTGSVIPAAGDNICQLGHRTDVSRQNAIIISSFGEPSIKQYLGIHSYTLSGCESTVLAPSGNKIVGKLSVKSGTVIARVPCDREAWYIGMICNYYDRVSHNGALWLCVIQDGTTTTEEPSISSEAWQKQVSEGEDGESPIQVTILSSRGNLFYNGVVDTVFTARVYRGQEDITDTINPSCFKWTRTSNDAQGDIAWNLQHETFGSNVISITSADVYVRAVFNCNVTLDN